MEQEKDVKKILYDKYVSSGQAKGVDDERDAFIGRSFYIKKVIKDHFPQDKHIRIGDLACGPGIYLYFLKKYGYTNVEGVDISKEQINIAHKLGVSEAKEREISKYLDSKDDAYFSLLLLIDILEHFEIEDGYKLLCKVFDKLEKGGKCILHVPNAEGIFGTRVLYGDLTHEMAFTQSSIRQLLKTVGFSKIEVYEDKPVVHGLTSFCRRILWDLLTLPHRLLLASESGTFNTYLSQNILVVAHK